MNRVRIGRGVLALLGLTLLTASASVRAEEGQRDPPAASDQAKDMAAEAFWKGKKAYDEGLFEQAQEHFHQAYVLTNDPELLYDIAQTYRQMGDCRKALAAYQDFLRLAPNSPLAELTEKHVLNLQSSCSTTAVTTGAEPDAPAAVSVQPQPSTVRAGNVQRLRRESDVPVFQASNRDVPAQSASRRTLQIWTWTTLAAGAVAGGTVAGLGIWNYQRRVRWRERDQNLALGPALQESEVDWLARQRQNDDLAVSINSMDPVLLGLGLGAAALFVTSAVLYVVTPGKPPKQTAAPERLRYSPTLAIDSRSVYAAIGTSF